MITVENYFTGPDGVRRDLKYASDLTLEIRENAAGLVMIVSVLLKNIAADGVEIPIDPGTKSAVHSGWRPPAVNDKTSNAAKLSTHLRGLGVDLFDPHRTLGTWAVNHTARLKELGLWMEDPRWCPTWLHVQAAPPGHPPRPEAAVIYIPSTAPALAAALQGQPNVAHA